MTDPDFKQAVIDHFIKNFRQTNNPYSYAKMRMGEISELFRALAEDEKIRPIDNRADSTHTRQVQIELDRLNSVPKDEP